jgi:hypothetical protein
MANARGATKEDGNEWLALDERGEGFTDCLLLPHCADIDSAMLRDDRAIHGWLIDCSSISTPTLTLPG